MALTKLAIVALLCFLYLLPPAQSAHLKYCDKKGNYAVKVKSVEIFPDPVVSGQPATFNVSASTGKAISEGKFVVEVSLFGIHVHSETHELGEEVSLPIAPGKFVLSHTQTLPSFTPPGSYTVKMRMEGNGRELTCFTFDFKIKFGFLASSSA